MFQPGLLKDRFILVTGGGTGLGKAMARRFAALGAELMICGRREDVLAGTAGEIAAESGRPVLTHACDLRDPVAVSGLMDVAFAHRPLDALVNNAAANFVARTETLSARALEAILDSSMHSAAFCTVEAGRRWLAGGHEAVVLSIVSSYAWHGSPYVVPSAMAKAGLLAMTRSLATEWGPRGIRFVAIAPGAFPTQGAWERLVPRPDLAHTIETANAFGRPGRPEELADLAAFLLSDGAAYIHGECVTIDGGRWLRGAASFRFLDQLSDDDWAAMKPAKRRGS